LSDFRVFAQFRCWR